MKTSAGSDDSLMFPSAGDTVCSFGSAGRSGLECDEALEVGRVLSVTSGSSCELSFLTTIAGFPKLPVRGNPSNKDGESAKVSQWDEGTSGIGKCCSWRDLTGSRFGAFADLREPLPRPGAPRPVTLALLLRVGACQCAACPSGVDKDWLKEVVVVGGCDARGTPPRRPFEPFFGGIMRAPRLLCNCALPANGLREKMTIYGEGIK